MIGENVRRFLAEISEGNAFGEKITLDEDVYVGAKKCIDEMIRLG